MRVFGLYLDSVSWIILSLVMSKKNEKWYYAVGVGRETGIFDSWTECKKHIDGVKRPKFRKFQTMTEAQEFLNKCKEKSQLEKATESPKFNFNREVMLQDDKVELQRPQLKGERFRKNNFLNGKNAKGNHLFSRFTTKKCTSKENFSSLSLNQYSCHKPELENNSSNFDPFEMNPPPRYFDMKLPAESDVIKVKCFGSKIKETKEVSTVDKCENTASSVIKKDEIYVFSTGNSQLGVAEKEVFKNTQNNELGKENSKNYNEILNDSLYTLINECVHKTKDTINTIMRYETQSCETNVWNCKKNINDRGQNNKNSTDAFDSASMKELSIGKNLDGTTYKNFAVLRVNNGDSAVACVTKTLESVTNVVSLVLQKVTSGIVAALGNGAVSDDSNLKYQVGDIEECIKSNSFSGMAKQSEFNCSANNNRRLENDITDVAQLNEKINNCEKKIDLCLSQTTSIVSRLTEAKGELADLSRICKSLFLNARGLMSLKAKKGTISEEKLCGTTTSEDLTVQNIKIEDFEANDFNDYETPSKKRRSDSSEQITRDSQAGDVQRDQDIKQEKSDYVGFTMDEDDFVVVFTDGACSNNGTCYARGGIGIWFGPGHPLNVSKQLVGVQTNNNAEIQAARIAIELALNAGISKLKICTDSQFLINCVTKWMPQWKLNGWINTKNKPVENRTELQKLDKVANLLSLRWEHVAGHSGIRGNEEADRLANQGAAF